MSITKGKGQGDGAVEGGGRSKAFDMCEPGNYNGIYRTITASSGWEKKGQHFRFGFGAHSKRN